MGFIITKRKRNQGKIIKLGLKPKSPIKNTKLRMTPPKTTQYNKSQNKTPNRKTKKKTQQKKKTRVPNLFEDPDIIKYHMFPSYHLDTFSYKGESVRRYFKTQEYELFKTRCE